MTHVYSRIVQYQFRTIFFSGGCTLWLASGLEVVQSTTYIAFFQPSKRTPSMGTKEEKQPVAEYYRGKRILVTGASGFIGKVLIWKLLHACPDLDTIYVLVRPKYGKDVQLRLDEILQTPIFDSFRKENLSILSKVKAVAGDVLEDGLGLSEEDERELSCSVHIIFHIAATVTFNASLKDAVKMNVEGTRKILNLALKMSNLEALVHTSTTYCHCDIDVLEEKTYKTKETPEQVMNLMEWMEPEMLRSIQKKLIGPHPNTYTYSKRLAENLVEEYSHKLPIVIARPSIVTPSLSEPLPGWVDNMNGPVGIFVAAGKGVLRVVWLDRNCHPDMIAVDVVCNGLIVVAWKTGKDTRRPGETLVYNLGLLEMEPITYGEVSQLGLEHIFSFPFSLVFWFPTITLHRNFYVYTVLTICLQWIPAYLVDAILFLLGFKTFMVRVQWKILHGMKMLNYFNGREWNFSKNNILRVREELSEKDREVFKLTNEGVNTDEYLLNAIRLSRWYMLKDDLANMPTARFRMKMLYVLHCFVKLLFYIFVGWILSQVALKLYA